MANQNQEKVNGFGMSNEEIQKLVDRQKKWDAKNERNKIAKSRAFFKGEDCRGWNFGFPTGN